MTLLDLVTVLDLVLLAVLAFTGAPVIYLGLPAGIVLACTGWPFDLRDQIPYATNQFQIVSVVAIVLLGLRIAERLPLRDGRAFVMYVTLTLFGYVAWRLGKALYEPSLAYIDALVVDAAVGVLLVAGLPAVALLLTRRRRPNGTPRSS